MKPRPSELADRRSGAQPGLALKEAIDRILAAMTPPEASEEVSLADALGRVAAADVLASVALPPFPASAMDGYAWRWQANVRRLRVVGTSLAGHPYADRVRVGECVRITTGAVLPSDCDTVVIQEDCQRIASPEATHIDIQEESPAGANVRPAGHDLQPGMTVVARGKRLDAADTGALAAAGCARVTVYARPRIAVFSSGDELQAPGSPLAHGQIYDSNRHALAALLAGLPVEMVNLGVLPDAEPAIVAALSEASASCRLIITSGGVSVGDADRVRSALESLGELAFWRLKLKPGKPLAFGRIGQSHMLGLPGNPVSSLVTALLVAKPAVAALCGMSPRPPLAVPASLDDHIRHKPGREEYQRGLLSAQAGELSVRTTGDQNSNRMSSFSTADCLIRIPASEGDLAPGSRVWVLPFEGLF